MIPNETDNPRAETASIAPSVLRGSYRASRDGPTLVRSENIEITEESTLEVLTPLVDQAEEEPIRILHVDDDPELADVTSVYLERFNDDFQVVTETTVVEALDRLRNEQIDCVISDYQMPNTNGLEFLEIVREQYPDLPFILFTGRGSEEIASEAIEAGVTDYMQKGGGPDQYEVLANRVDNAVDRYRTRQQFWDALSWYQRLVEQEIVGVFVVQGEELVYANRKFADVFGYDRSDLIGKPITLIATSDSRDGILEALTASEEGFQYEFTGQRRDGTEIAVEIHGGPVEYDGDAAHMGILRDSADR
jgi:PAS domain S-box-containing protein